MGDPLISVPRAEGEVDVVRQKLKWVKSFTRKEIGKESVVGDDMRFWLSNSLFSVEHLSGS